MHRLIGLEFVLEMDGEPIRSHWVRMGEETVEQAMKTIAQYSHLTVSYDRKAIRIAPKSSLPEASPETREKLTLLKERLRAELASVTEPRRENLAKIGDSIDADFAALAEAVKATLLDMAQDMENSPLEKAKPEEVVIRDGRLENAPSGWTSRSSPWTGRSSRAFWRVATIRSA